MLAPVSSLRSCRLLVVLVRDRDDTIVVVFLVVVVVVVGVLRVARLLALGIFIPARPRLDVLHC